MNDGQREGDLRDAGDTTRAAEARGTRYEYRPTERPHSSGISSATRPQRTTHASLAGKSISPPLPPFTKGQTSPPVDHPRPPCAVG